MPHPDDVKRNPGVEVDDVRKLELNLMSTKNVDDVDDLLYILMVYYGLRRRFRNATLTVILTHLDFISPISTKSIPRVDISYKLISRSPLF